MSVNAGPDKSTQNLQPNSRKLDSPATVKLIDFPRYSNTGTNNQNRNFSPLNSSILNGTRNGTSQVVEALNNSKSYQEKNILFAGIRKSDRSTHTPHTNSYHMNDQYSGGPVLNPNHINNTSSYNNNPYNLESHNSSFNQYQGFSGVANSSGYGNGFNSGTRENAINVNGITSYNKNNGSSKSNYNILKCEYGAGNSVISGTPGYGNILDSSPMGYRNISSTERYAKGNILLSN